MKDAEKPVPESQEAGLKRIVLRFEGCPPVLLSSRPRGYHSPVHVHHDIDAVCVVVEATDSRAEISLGRMCLHHGQQSDPLPLSRGRNVFSGSITTMDGRTKTGFNFKVFRTFPQPEWERVTDAAPWSPRDSAGELVFHDRMWLLGGFTPTPSNDVWSSEDGAAWTKEGDIPTARGLDIPIAFVFNDRMWVTDVDGVLFSSADGKSWSVATDRAPWRGRDFAGGCAFDSKMWVMGGSKAGALLNDVWSSPDGAHWTLASPAAPWSKREITHAPLVLDGRMWLLGGGARGPDYYPFAAWNDVWSTADGIHWERTLEHAPWPARIWGSSAVYRERMWITGGFRSEPTWENLGDVWYSSDGASWRQLKSVETIRHSGHRNAPFALRDSIWEPRHEHSVYAHADALWVAGGMVWPLKNDVWRLSIPGLCFVTQPVIEVYAGTLYEYPAHADFNRSRRPLSYRLKRGPNWLSVDKETGLVRGTAAQPDDFEVCLEARDENGETALQTYVLHILPFR